MPGKSSAVVPVAVHNGLLAAGLDHLPVGFAVFDAQLCLVICNELFAKLRAYPAELCRPGTPVDAFLRLNAEHGDYGKGDPQQLLGRRIEQIRRFEPYESERVVGKDRVLQIRHQPLPEGGLLISYTDITQLKRREQEIAEKNADLKTTLAKLRESDERYTLAMAGANEGIYDWQAMRDEIFISDRFKTLIQIPRFIFTLTPADWLKRIHPQDKAQYRRAIRAHFQGETEFFHLEFRVRRGDGSYIWILQRGALSRNKAGRIYRMAGSIGDITARKQAEIELHQAKDAALQASRTKSAFLANMSHELRTPMNAILGFTRLVMRRAGDKLPQQQFDNLKKILISSEQLLELINDILDLSRVEAGHVEINRSDIDAADLAEECLRIVEPLLKSEKVTLIQQIEAELPLLHNDRDKLRQVLINLLSNAVKFTEQGSIRLSIEHREEQHQGGSRRSIIFRVSDTGIGIPDDALERVFEEFHQVDSSSTRQYGGTGLGLSIARRLTHLIGGEIGVVSKLGQGSTFTVTLPL